MFIAQLETVVEVARYGNISHAAEALSMTQPAVSWRLRSLEAELGISLFVRSRRGVRPTKAGKAFLPFAERAVEAANEATRIAAAYRRGEDIEALTLGVTGEISLAVLPDALAQLERADPSVRLSLRTARSLELVDLVLADQIDMALIRDARHPGLDRLPLYDDELLVVGGRGHPLAARARVRLADLAKERLVLVDPTGGYQRETAFLVGKNATPPSMITLDNTEAGKRMVERGIGIALLPRTSVAAELASGALEEIRVEGTRLRHRIVAIRRNDAGPLPTSFTLLIEALREAGHAATAPGSSPRKKAH